MRSEDIIREVADTFFYVWRKFTAEIGAEMEMIPHQWDIVEYLGNNKWRLRNDFNFSTLDSIGILDKTFPHTQYLRADIVTKEGKEHIVVTFGMMEEHATFVPYLVYMESIERAKIDDIRNRVKDLIVTWYESIMRRNQEMLWNFVKDKYDKIITYK
ncbi:MAG: hypothetical protein DRN20_03710 [Thermoplasmata archaeon]|nr:MAG: hypothetical protein DRN20_03710 [Thermoplasmata archaeon]